MTNGFPGVGGLVGRKDGRKERGLENKTWLDQDRDRNRDRNLFSFLFGWTRWCTKRKRLLVILGRTVQFSRFSRLGLLYLPCLPFLAFSSCVDGYDKYDC